MSTKVRPTTEALIIAARLQGRHADKVPTRHPEDVADMSYREPDIEAKTADDKDWDRLISLLTDMDARTGRPDPTKRPRAVARKK